MEIILKKGSELTREELDQISSAIFREFKVPFRREDQFPDKLFFLLKEQDVIFSMGALWEVKPVIFDGEISIYPHGQTLVNTAIIYIWIKS